MRETGPILRFEDTAGVPPSGRNAQQEIYTRSFAGVRDGDLPDGLTDHVDIDLKRVTSAG
jgi:hypothetical protein